jgi:DNA-binding response OmpR family regulator
MHVLFVGVAPRHRTPIRHGLDARGGIADIAGDSAEAYRLLTESDYDAILLGLSARPDDDVTAIRRWRNHTRDIGILALLPRPDVTRIVQVIEDGADDCMAVPFHLDELLARLLALGRRRRNAQEPVLRIGDLEIDTGARTVQRGSRTMALTRREFSLLQLLALYRGRVVSRRMIRKHLYDAHGENTSNVVDVYIHQLRHKIDAGFEEPLILTRWGQGYLLRDGA